MGDLDFSGKSFDEIRSGFAAFNDLSGPAIAQVVFFIGALEIWVMKDATGENDFVGDFRNGWLDFGWDSFDDATKLKKRGIELNQGRAAMMGILALMVHEQLGVSLLPGGN